MLSRLKERLRLEARVWSGRKEAKSSNARIALFHDFAPPPTGGGHQFLRALMAEWERMGIEVAVNCLPDSAEAVLINSFNFTSDLLRRLWDRDVRMVHRVDGPLQVYRGFDDGTDLEIARLNREFSSASIFQSEFSRSENDRLGFGLLPGPVICNAADRTIFQPRQGKFPSGNKPIRVIAASWSDNPNKGLDVFQWLEKNLDSSRFQFTFVGRAQMEFENLRHIPAVPSDELATLLRENDIFLTASLNDPCSNSVIEALTVGLPCVYRRSGGHPELVGKAGAGFDSPEEIPDLLDEVGQNWAKYAGEIRVPEITSVAKEYLRVLEVTP
ncbi:glycosyltransferase family 4 protein [Puniceicoccus vermicola]|uniref:Glycosyltransferase family 4 protein n=1 Tax=Puniceicoccus vermicola TaxID=388746 RepID=A0A7X1E3L2_9BACT|nr:glycosyltransferase family 4 protein [Puniceicoccus vermicola]MBC2601099.1 glycosyltransferase family 4 protein [Puniceicoccus vermicola]